jgi:hypothetical protein
MHKTRETRDRSTGYQRQRSGTFNERWQATSPIGRAPALPATLAIVRNRPEVEQEWQSELINAQQLNNSRATSVVSLLVWLM